MKKFLIILFSRANHPNDFTPLNTVFGEKDPRISWVMDCVEASSGCLVNPDDFGISSRPTHLFLYETKPNYYIEAARIEGPTNIEAIKNKLAELQDFDHQAGNQGSDGIILNPDGEGPGGLFPGFGWIGKLPWWMYLALGFLIYKTTRR